MPALPFNSAELAYAAGLIDGEGTITIGRRHRRDRTWYHAYIHLSNTDPALVVWMHERFGGHVRPLKDRAAVQRPAWRWQLDGPRAERLLRMVSPYLVSKKAQARVALALFADVKATNRRRLSATDDARRAGLKAEMLVLNRRGAA